VSLTLSRYLKDFSAEQVVPPHVEDMVFAEPAEFIESPLAPPIDIEAERRAAYMEGHEAATQELTQKHQAELEARDAASRAEMDAMRIRYEEQAAEKIAADVTRIAAMLGQAISTEVAAILAPIMTETLTTKAVADLAELVRVPRHLFEVLHDRLGDDGSLLRHVEADDIDLTVTIGESVLVTRMSAWAASLKEILK